MGVHLPVLPFGRAHPLAARCSINAKRTRWGDEHKASAGCVGMDGMDRRVRLAPALTVRRAAALIYRFRG